MNDKTVSMEMRSFVRKKCAVNRSFVEDNKACKVSCYDINHFMSKRTRSITDKFADNDFAKTSNW